VGREGDCTFCRIVSRGLPCYRVYEDEKTLAFLDINPIAPGHTLVVPKAHREGLADLSPDDAQAVILTLQRTVRGLEKALAPEGLNLIANRGRAAGQMIFHFHFHIIPRYSGDGIEFRIRRGKLSPETLEGVAARIRACLEEV
jgi:histidine triad (HIT) family protein